MEIVINWHFTEGCNYSCKYCFAQWDCSSEIWHSDEAIDRTLSELKKAEQSVLLKRIRGKDTKPVVRINFVGGEPLVIGSKMEAILRKAKAMGFSTSVITNGSLLERNFKIAKYIDIIGISIDSLSVETCRKIGRCDARGNLIDKTKLRKIVDSLKDVNSSIKLKFNTVVNNHNFTEKLIPVLQEFNPDKIKLFRVIPFGESSICITDEMFKNFLDDNDTNKKNVFVEDNSDMTHSYLMVDPKGRFFSNGMGDKYKYSKPIHEVGFDKALESVDFKPQTYLKRYGIA